MYAIIEDSGTQIKVSPGAVVKVALRELAADAATITFDKVLLVSDGPATESGKDGEAQPSVGLKIGTPLVPGAKVTADILGHEKTPKVVSYRFRRRKNVLRRRGHRQDYIKVKITSIQA